MKLLNKGDRDPLSSVTNFKDIKSYLSSHPNEQKDLSKGSIGQLPLQDIKGHFEAEK